MHTFTAHQAFREELKAIQRPYVLRRLFANAKATSSLTPSGQSFRWLLGRRHLL